MSKEARKYIKEQLEYAEERIEKIDKDEEPNNYQYWNGYHDALKWALRWVTY